MRQMALFYDFVALFSLSASVCAIIPFVQLILLLVSLISLFMSFRQRYKDKKKS